MEKKEYVWLSGTVVHGDGRGRKLGFPTANLVLSNPTLRPENGVYACFAKIPNEVKLFKAMLHTGPRPTFIGAEPTVELHILEIQNDVDLYTQTVSFAIVKKIRDIVKFDSVDELITAIKSDAQITFKVLETSAAF